MKSVQKRVLMSFCVVYLLSLTSCLPTALTAGYSARAAVAEDLSSDGRERFVNEAVDRANEYTDKKFSLIRKELMKMRKRDISEGEEDEETIQ